MDHHLPEEGGRNEKDSPEVIFRLSPDIYLTTKSAIIAFTCRHFLLERELTAPGTISDLSLVR